MMMSRPPHRSPVKNLTRERNKEELKQRCIARVTASRRQLFDTLRGNRAAALAGQPLASGTDDRSLSELVNEEWSQMQAESATSLLETEKLSGDDYIEVMTFLEELLQQDMRAQGTPLVNQSSTQRTRDRDRVQSSDEMRECVCVCRARDAAA